MCPRFKSGSRHHSKKTILLSLERGIFWYSQGLCYDRNILLSMKKSIHISWLDTPEEHDYPAAADYLTLLYDPETVKGMIEALKGANISFFKAKDIFRASHLSLLWVSNSHVEKDQEKIKKWVLLSPLLLVRDKRTSGVIVADGYHRLCAVYGFDEDAVIPSKIVG